MKTTKFFITACLLALLSLFTGCCLFMDDEQTFRIWNNTDQTICINEFTGCGSMNVSFPLNLYPGSARNLTDSVAAAGTRKINFTTDFDGSGSKNYKADIITDDSTGLKLKFVVEGGVLKLLKPDGTEITLTIY